MTKQAVRRFLFVLSVILLVGIITAGCVSDKQESSEQNRAESSSGIVLQTTAPASGDATAPSPSSESEAGANHSTPAVKSSEPAAGLDQDAQETPVSSGSPASTQAPIAREDITAAPSTKADAIKTPAPTKAPVGVKESPSPTVRPTSSPSAAPVGSTEKASTVTFSITGDSESGVILAPSVVEVKDGDSVMDLLKRITRKNKIQMEFKGIGPVAYVEGIDNLYEYDKGAESGWMYRVNGVFPNIGAAGYTVKSGDRIEWLYTLDLGKDLGAKAP
ncbi:DUF4430 domain-containing protein [Paenibacillus wynnii]|uniref:DUF4430 domain-containing protein n=1 Tax=Paenibacillus wynnii TaxID=268407 RepID=UPI0027939DE4|nr:DUF4430 domain-containing protein [Paenibacillus wynnii]MDQ0195474.1 hypothetical protein [Paenibacillus wynnii]